MNHPRPLSILAVFVIMFLTSCGTRSEVYASTSASTAYDRMISNSYEYRTTNMYPNPEISDFIDGIIAYGEKFLGRRYGSKAPDGRRFDCSGYVSFIFKKFGIDLPRSSRALSTYAKKIKVPEPGDLLFFTGRNAKSQHVGHVALVVSNDNGKIVMIHSTNQRGIIKETLNTSDYFKRRFLFAGRVPKISKMLAEEMDQSQQVNDENKSIIELSKMIYPSVSLLNVRI